MGIICIRILYFPLKPDSCGDATNRIRVNGFKYLKKRGDGIILVIGLKIVVRKIINIPALLPIM